MESVDRPKQMQQIADNPDIALAWLEMAAPEELQRVASDYLTEQRRAQELELAIRKHRSYLWGNGAVESEADADLYAALRLTDSAPRIEEQADAK